MLVEDDKITGIVKGNTVPDGFKEINLEGKYLILRGLLICMFILQVWGNGKPKKKRERLKERLDGFRGPLFSGGTEKDVRDFK